MALKWFTSCISHRFQAVKIKSTLSELHDLLFRVPLGSDIRPLFFTSPLSKVIGRHSNTKFHFYVDDTKFFVNLSYQNAALAFHKMNSCLQDAQEWMSPSALK